MKVEVNENKQVQERPFPKLMKGECGILVLMIKPNYGVRIDSNIHYSEYWEMKLFQDFNGSITLSNE